jgi:hypothetical protein
MNIRIDIHNNDVYVHRYLDDYVQFVQFLLVTGMQVYLYTCIDVYIYRQIERYVYIYVYVYLNIDI